MSPTGRCRQLLLLAAWWRLTVMVLVCTLLCWCPRNGNSFVVPRLPLTLRGRQKEDAIINNTSVDSISHHRRRRRHCAAAASSSSSSDGVTATTSNNKMKKTSEELDNLLTDMGLKPVHKKAKPSKRTSNGINIDIDTQLQYARNGHAVLRQFLDPTKINLLELRSTLLEYAHQQELQAWHQKVYVARSNNNKNHNKNHDDNDDDCQTIEECQAVLKVLLGPSTASSLPFLQYFNTWRSLSVVHDLIFDYDFHRLAQAASILMDVPTVRLYQDALFYKRRQDGPTPWHVDGRMAPFDTSHMITFWIPLQVVPRNGSGLIFCSKSHADFALPYWNPPKGEDDDDDDDGDDDDKTRVWERLAERYPKRLVDYMPLQIGDVTVHSGWTLHCSNGGSGSGSGNDDDRLALAVTFVDGDAEIRPDWQANGDNEDRWSYQEWCCDVLPRRKFRHDLVPIVWPPNDESG